MILGNVLIVVHHDDEKCVIPQNIKTKIDQLISVFPSHLVYYTPSDQDKEPINKEGRVINKNNTNSIFFVGGYTRIGSCVHSQIRLLHNEGYTNKMILVVDALFEESNIPFLRRELDAEGIRTQIITSSNLFQIIIKKK